MDDDLFGLVFDGNIPASEVLLKTILKRDDIKIVSVEGQKEVRNPEVGGRRIRLDILATDRNKRYYNVEVQRQNRGAHPKRARFHSNIHNGELAKGVRYFKESEGGRKRMCESVERFAGISYGKVSAAFCFMVNGCFTVGNGL